MYSNLMPMVGSAIGTAIVVDTVHRISKGHKIKKVPKITKQAYNTKKGSKNYMKSKILKTL